MCCLFSVESLKPGKVTVETQRPVTMATDTVEAVVCDVNDIKSGESVLIFITIYYSISNALFLCHSNIQYLF